MKTAIKIICFAAMFIGIIIGIFTVSRSDYEVETNVPKEEQMTDAELYGKIGISIALMVGGAVGMELVTRKDSF